MRRLKSSYHDLHRMFRQTVTVREIAEPLASFERDQPAARIRAFMKQRDFDVVGVREEGMVTGYVVRDGLGEGVVGDHEIDFENEITLEESAPMLDALEALGSKDWVFIQFLGNHSGIITRGDLQKAPMRMWLFGLISLLEMQLLRCIREAHPNDTWTEFIGAERLAAARRLHVQRQVRNDAIDLAECLQLADKKTAFARSPRLSELIAPQSKRTWEKFMSDVENLRNRLAHANDLDPNAWTETTRTAEQVEVLLMHLEETANRKI
jgi:hypothetical protein